MARTTVLTLTPANTPCEFSIPTDTVRFAVYSGAIVVTVRESFFSGRNIAFEPAVSGTTGTVTQDGTTYSFK